MKTILTNGCFDILHEGHIDGLRQMQALGGWLVVALNSDESVRRLKGPARPINEYSKRASALLNTGYVDEVLHFTEEDELREIVKTVKPDHMVKDSEYRNQRITGQDELEAYGGSVIYQDRLPGRPSTTRVIHRMKVSA